MEKILKNRFGSKLKENVLMKDLTTVGIGGPARFLLIASSPQELKEAVEFATSYQLKFLVIGAGSNLLVADEGFDGLVIKDESQGITQKNNLLIVQSGTLLQNLVDLTISEGLEGMERLTGIPGTVAGAIVGNAGAYGQTISDHLIKVVGYNGQQIKEFLKEDCGFSYRDSKFKTNGYIILEAHFQLPPGDAQKLADEAAQILTQRQIKYPPGIKCPGSFFKNVLVEKIPQQIFNLLPPHKDTYGKVPAWFFLEQVGAKGAQLGKIQIAPYHANLFINLGDGRAKDFWQLASKYYHKVKEKFGVELEPEVQLINLPPLNRSIFR